METNYTQCSNLKKGSCTLKYSLLALILCLFLSPMVIMAQEGEEPEEKVEKVTEKMFEKEEQAQNEGLEQTPDEQIEKDVAEISKTVEKGTVPTVIKALSLAVIIAGFAFLYLPKKKKDTSNGN